MSYFLSKQFDCVFVRISRFISRVFIKENMKIMFKISSLVCFFALANCERINFTSCQSEGWSCTDGAPFNITYKCPESDAVSCLFKFDMINNNNCYS